MQMTSDSVVAMSIIVRAWMSNIFPSMSMDQGPTKSTGTSSNGTDDVSSRAGNSPWPGGFGPFTIAQVHVNGRVMIEQLNNLYTRINIPCIHPYPW
jgi:hypothetical protein